MGWGHEKARSPTHGLCFCVHRRDTCPRAMGVHAEKAEFIPGGHMEPRNTFRQRSVRSKQAFSKARSSWLGGAEHGGRETVRRQELPREDRALRREWGQGKGLK